MAQHLQIRAAIRDRTKFPSKKRGELMMKSELSLTSSLTFAVGTASQDVALESVEAIAERRERKAKTAPPPVVEFDEETLVVDDRFGQSPAQLVESKLIRKLQETSLPVSHLQTRSLLRRR